MTNSKWVTLHKFSSLINHASSHCDKLSKWVTLPCFFGRQSQANHVSPHDQSLWVQTLLYFCQSHQLCLILWPTGSEWHCFISLAGSLINHVSLHDQQDVSDTIYLLAHHLTTPWLTDCKSMKFPTQQCFIASHSVVTNSQWVVYHLCQSLLLISQIGCENGFVFYQIISDNIIPWWLTASAWYNYLWITLDLMSWATGSE